jgi:hypothetical protein
MIALGVSPRSRPPLSDLLSPAELGAVVLDGELYRLGDDVAPIDLPVTTESRARTLRRTILDRRVIVSDRCAAWVWGWVLRPPPLSTSVSISARVPSPDRRRLRAREVVIDPDETVEVAGLVVTTPLRTLVDLARHDTAPDAIDVVARGMLEHRIRPEELAQALDRRTRLSYVRRARALAAAAALLVADAPSGLSRC